MKLILVIAVICTAFPAVLSQGFGCDDNYIPDDERVDCAANQATDEDDCRNARNCTWCPTTPDAGIPWCYVPGAPSAGGYQMVGEPVTTPNGVRVNLVKAEPAAYRYGRRAIKPKWDGEAETLTLEAEFQADYRLRVKITDGTPRWEVPLEINAPAGGNSNLLYDITFSNDPLFSFKVIRKSSGAVLFDSSAGKFIFADQYLTLSWKVPTENVYGVGENEQHSFKHDFSQDLTWALWGRDQPPSHTNNMYGTQPVYTVLEADGSAHTVAIINSNAQEFNMKPGPMIKYTTIGGLFDFYFFLGPTPENAIQQYTEAVGRAPMPPYWGLGFQLCKYGYDSLENMKAAVDRTAAANIPHDVQYGDIDIMERALDFTYAQDRFAGLPEYIKELKTKGIKFVTILDPCISIAEPTGGYRPFDLGQEMDVWVKKADGSPVTGRVWPADPVYFPDYSKASTREWWRLLVKEFHDLLEFDGLWIDMNEPANFVTGDMDEGCPSNNLNNPPYVPAIVDRYLGSKTICPAHVDSVSTHYNTHSMYGWFESEPTLLGARDGTGKRSVVLSRSTFLGSGRWVAHWLGDNFSNWDNLYYSIIGMLQFNQFGIPFSGADICGFIGDSNAELCQRWMELGAFYPFSRNHNAIGTINQDPAVWGPAIATSSKTALEIRYTLLPYLYTLFYKHVTEGGTVARALWHEFPTDANTATIDRQFFWGSGLMISPVLTQGTTSIDAYIPNARFYSYYDGAEVATKGETTSLNAPMDFINLHVRGGNILPTQDHALNTQLSRSNPLGLIVALDDNSSASGALFYDDGETLDTHVSGDYFYAEYSLASGTLTATVVKDGYADMATKTLETIRLLGADTVSSVTVNGAAHSDFSKLPSGEVVVRNLKLKANVAFTIVFA